VVWLHEKGLELNQTYLLKHAGRLLKAKATSIRFGIDINALSEHAADHLGMNGIACVEFESSVPLYFDAYVQNRTTGSFILIDSLSNATVGAAMIREDLSQAKAAGFPSADGAVKARTGQVTREERQERHGHGPAIFSVQRNSEFAERLERTLFESGFEAVLVRAGEVPSSALPVVIAALWNAWFVIVYSSDVFTREEESSLQSIAGKLLFEIPVAAQAESAEENLERARKIAEALRGIDRENDRRKAD
jgi:hypothetical protein